MSDSKTWALSVVDFADLPSLANKLKRPTRAFDTWLAEQLSPATRTALASYRGKGANAAAFQEALLEDLNTLLRGPTIYRPQRFAGIALRPEAETLLSQKPQGDSLRRLNRLLIEDAYPQEIPARRSAEPQRTRSRRDHQVIATWVFGSLLFILLVSVLFFLPNLTPDRRALVRFFMALTAGFFAYFLGGQFSIEGKAWHQKTRAIGGIAVFVVLQFLVNPFSTQPTLGSLIPRLMRSDPEVAQAQRDLEALNLLQGEYTPGVLDKATAKAAREFAAKAGIRSSDYIGSELLTPLAAARKANLLVASPGAGRVEGVLSDRRGRPMGGLLVGLRRGPEVTTDSRGVFVLSDVPTGSQQLVVRASAERGREWAQFVEVRTNGATKVSIAYDSATSRLGLLLITSPTDDSVLPVRQVGQQFLAEVYGRCDGLDDVLGTRFDIWVLIRSQLDQRLWLQHPPALVDPTAGTWKANVQLGSADTPPKDGEQWDIMVVAAPASSDMRRILNVTRLSDLPDHIQGNFVTVTNRIGR